MKEHHNVHQEVEKLKFKTRRCKLYTTMYFCIFICRFSSLFVLNKCCLDSENWKGRIEKENVCYYPKEKIVPQRQNGITWSYFYCHRTGFIISESTDVRRIKNQGTNKIYETCTSSLVYTICITWILVFTNQCIFNESICNLHSGCTLITWEMKHYK